MIVRVWGNALFASKTLTRFFRLASGDSWTFFNSSLSRSNE